MAVAGKANVSITKPAPCRRKAARGLRFMRKLLFTIGTTAFIAVFLAAKPAMATQGHGGIEGVYAHQFAHLFFLFSMGSLIYWLRERGLVRDPGWRMIQYSALFFILWNIDTVLVHALDDQFELIQVQRIGTWRIHLTDSFDHNALKVAYYLAKLDHLLCVPALVFLYVGLRRLLERGQPESSGDVPP